MSKVNIIVPCYNGEKFVKRCMYSILSQNYEDIDIIFVDDGSIDNSKQELLSMDNEFKSKGVQYKYIYQENSGAGAAINKGLKFVTGEYLTLLDVDDIFLDNSIMLRANFLDEHPDYSLVRTDGYIVKENNINKIIRNFCMTQTDRNCKDLFQLLLEGKTYNWAGSYMIRTSVLFKWYPEREIYTSRYGQNLQLILPVIYKNKIGFIDKPLMKYIQQEYSFTQTSNDFEIYQKEVDNLKGYTDIRHTILKYMGIENLYKCFVDNQYYINRLNLAIVHNHKEDAKCYFKILKNSKNLSLDLKLYYYRYINDIFSNFKILFLTVPRIIRKLKHVDNSY